MMLLVLGFLKVWVLTYAYVKAGGWVLILNLLTDAYVPMGGWVGILEMLTDAYVGRRVDGWQMAVGPGGWGWIGSALSGDLLPGRIRS